MRTIFVFIISAIISGSAYSQVSVGRKSIGNFKDFKKGEYDVIKSKTSVFVVDDLDKEVFGDVVRESWTISPYIVIDRAEYIANQGNYINEKNAIFEMRAFTFTGKDMNNFDVNYLFILYEYFYPTDIGLKKEKLEFERNQIAAVYFGGDEMWTLAGDINHQSLQKNLNNYKIGYLKNYIQFINNTLKDEGISYAYDTVYDKSKIKALSTKILYVPEFFKIISVYGKEDEKRENPDELFKKYPYKYEFVGEKEMDDKILNATEDLYYVMYNKVNGRKFISVVNGKTGEIIYKSYGTLSSIVKTNDLTDIASKIKK